MEVGQNQDNKVKKKESGLPCCLRPIVDYYSSVGMVESLGAQ